MHTAGTGQTVAGSEAGSTLLHSAVESQADMQCQAVNDAETGRQPGYNIDVKATLWWLRQQGCKGSDDKG